MFWGQLSLPPALPAIDRQINGRTLLRRLCPISLQVMRRPVLPSSGQAYDEVNIARFSAAGKSQCPVSGAPLECHRRGPSKGKVMLTPDYALRNVIRHQAQQAKVCPSAAFCDRPLTGMAVPRLV